MSEAQFTPKIGMEFKAPIQMATDTVARLNQEGLRSKYEPLAIIDEAREVIARMPSNKKGVVIGSGGNTQLWRDKGWRTLDIDVNVRPDVTLDANYLTSEFQPNSQDYILAECITFDPLGKEGVSPARLLQQANEALKIGGTIIIESASFENEPGATTPNRREFPKQMVDHGFDVVIEIDKIEHYGTNSSAQRVIFHGRKIANGYDEDRSKAIEEKRQKFNTNTGLPI